MAGETLYYMGNFATPSASTPAGVSMTAGQEICALQLATTATRQLAIVEYGISMSGAPAAATISLRETSATTATAASMTAGSLLVYTQGPASQLTSSTSACCWYTSGTALPTATVSQVYDAQLLTTNTYIKQFPLGREPVVPVSAFLQLCVQVPTTAVNMLCYVIWRE
jgi:hypothetical protein